MEKVQELLGAAVQIKSCQATGWRGGQGGQASPQSPVSFIYSTVAHKIPRPFG